jgi:hypothetical protein
VRNSVDGERELVMARWDMPQPPQFGGQPAAALRLSGAWEKQDAGCTVDG